MVRFRFLLTGARGMSTSLLKEQAADRGWWRGQAYEALELTGFGGWRLGGGSARLRDGASRKRTSRPILGIPRPGRPAGAAGLAPPTLDGGRNIHYHTVVDRLGTAFAALSDPTRRALIKRLTHGPASVHGLTEPFAVSQQMISKHIAYLVRARIVKKTKRGRESVCTLRPEAIKAVSDWALDYRRLWEERFDRLDAVLADMNRRR